MNAHEQNKVLETQEKLLERQAFYSRATAIFGTLGVVVLGFGTENIMANWSQLLAAEGLIMAAAAYSLYERKLARQEYDALMKKYRKS
jgi:hypothetical protein